MEGTTGSLAQTVLSQSTWHKIMSRQFWNIHSEEDSITSLTNLFKCSVTCKVKKLFLMIWWKFLLLLILLLEPLSRSWLHSLDTLI